MKSWGKRPYKATRVVRVTALPVPPHRLHFARASMPSAKKKSKSTGKQSSLAGAGMFPMLTKTSVAIGLFCLVPGAFWERCPESDKDKKYKCTVMESLLACTRLAAAGRAPASSARRWARMAKAALMNVFVNSGDRATIQLMS